MRHGFGVVLAFVGSLAVGVVGLKGDSEVNYIQVRIVHHSSIAADVAVGLAAVDQLLLRKVNGESVSGHVVGL